MTDAELLSAHFRKIAAETKRNAECCAKHRPKLLAHAALLDQFADDMCEPGITDRAIVEAMIRACKAEQAIEV